MGPIRWGRPILFFQFAVLFPRFSAERRAHAPCSIFLSRRSNPCHQPRVSTMSLDETLYESIQPFIDKGLVTDVLQMLKSGKEATVFSCRGGPRLGGRLVAV